jgi:hypothetical protein
LRSGGGVPHSTANAESSGLDLVMARAATDRDFRRRLLADPRRAIRDAFGVEPPPGLKLRFIEKDSDVDLLLVLPNPIDSGELTSDDLGAVTGGVSWAWLACDA